MGILELQMLGSSVTVKTDTVTALYACVAAALGFDSTGAMAALQDSTGTASNLTGTTTLCSCDGGSMNGTQCVNTSCLYNPVSYRNAM